MNSKMAAIAAGSTSVYADLGYSDAVAMQRKATLAAEIYRVIKARRLTESTAADFLGIDPATVSQITRGQFRGVSESEMRDLIAKLGHS